MWKALEKANRAILFPTGFEPPDTNYMALAMKAINAYDEKYGQ
jgi:hypothetical protein